MNSSTKISSHSYGDSIELPGVSGWRWIPLPSADQVARAYNTCAPFLADSRSWLDFANDLYASHYFEHEIGWLRVAAIRPGCTAEIHGGSWEGHGSREADADTLSLLDFIGTEYKLLTLTCLAPEQNLFVTRWLQRLGFKQAGVLPAWDTWSGTPRNVQVFYREVNHGR